MFNRVVWGVGLIYLVVINSVSAVRPGAQLILTNAGLEYAAKIATEELKYAVENVDIKPIRGTGNGFGYHLYGLKIAELQVSQKSMRSVSDEGIRWTLTGAKITLNGNFEYTYKELFSDNGQFVFTASGVSFDMVVKITEFFETGHPVLQAGECNCHIGSLNIHFSWSYERFLYDILIELIRGRMKELLEKVVCEKADEAVNVYGNHALYKLRLITPISKKFLLDYRLANNPKFTDDYMRTDLTGEAFWTADIRETPLSPPPIPDPIETSKMVYIWLTEYVANTFAYSAFSHDYLQYTISKENMGSSSSYLDTKCAAFKCIGGVITQMGKLYPNSTVKIVTNATSAPIARFAPNEMRMNGLGEALFYAVTPNGDTHYMMHLGVNITVTGTVSVDDDRLYLHANKLSLKLHVVDSKIALINDVFLNAMSKTAISFYIKPKLNKWGAKGINLPLTGAVTLKNAKISIIKGSIAIESNVEYKTHIPTTTPMKDAAQCIFSCKMQIIGTILFPIYRLIHNI